jgi:hypothetical protein
VASACAFGHETCPRAALTAELSKWLVRFW